MGSNPHRLREFLKELPDFEDIEAEEGAKAMALAYPQVHAALAFLIDWPDHAMAAKLIETRSEELDGDAYYVLTPAVEAFDGHHSLAATLARRAMILFTLNTARSTRYKHAVRHLLECEAGDRTIDDYGDHPDHVTFVDQLRQRHGRKQGFGARFGSQGAYKSAIVAARVERGGGPWRVSTALALMFGPWRIRAYGEGCKMCPLTTSPYLYKRRTDHCRSRQSDARKGTYIS